MSESVLSVSHLTKSFGLFTAVHDVSFDLAPGSSLGIVGESGSGKTTLARMVIGLEAPTSGTITCCGHDRSHPSRSTKARRARALETQIVFQDPYASLDPRQTVEQALAEAVRLHARHEVRARVEELADMVALGARHLMALPRHLSGGQRQRVAIARALAANPKVLVLDESVAALDVSIQAQILNLLADIRERTAISYLFISHDLAVIRQVTEHAIVMRGGRVVESGATGELLRAPIHPYTRALLDSVPRPGWKPSRRTVLHLERGDHDAPDAD
ncbi:ABC transporter ATP-binding protein [Actinokineospora sp.]|uniref:ABC transporter ATP-binding protein n=1 Tax=Actinokineospora sp. TaxID=1872133 RepID=UPI003D6A00E9